MRRRRATGEAATPGDDRGARGSAALEFVVLAPLLVLLVLFVLWAGRAGRAGLVADLAAEEAAAAAALCCEEGDVEGRERVVAELLEARPGLDFLCIGGARPAGDRFVSESSLYFDPSDGGSAGGVGVLGVQVECETDGAVAPLRGLFPEVTFEGRASEVVRLSSPLGASGLPTLTVDDATAREDAAFVTFEAWLHQAQPKDVSVSWWVESQDGQAMGGVDYALVSGVVTVPAGSRTAQVRVPIIDDDLDEPDETFLLVLGSPAGVSLDRLAALGTITDNDPPVGISVTGATVDEGGPGTPGEVEFEVRLDHPKTGHADVSGQVVSFDYETLDGTAIAGGDYEAARGSARIMPGDSEFKLTVRLVGDDVHEAHEFFSLRLYNVMHAVPSTVSGQGYVRDDDEPVLWITDAYGVEGGGPLVFRVGLTALRPLPGPVTVSYETASGRGTAKGGTVCPATEGVADPVDYVVVSRDVVTFPAGGPWATDVTVVICDDGTDEGRDETFALALVGASGAKLPSNVSGVVGDDFGTGTILDSGSNPLIFVDDLTALEGAGRMEFRVRLSHATSSAVQVTATTVPGTALPVEDYQAQTRTVTIASGQREATFDVPLVDDAVTENTETFTVELSNAVDGVLGSDTSAEGTILDDDGPPYVTLAGPGRIREGTTGTFTVSLSWPAPAAVVVPFNFVDGTATLWDGVATSGYDYHHAVFGTTELTIPAGATTGRIRVHAVDDRVDEAFVETFAVVLGTVQGGIVTVPRATAEIEDIHELPTLTVTTPDCTTESPVTEQRTITFTLTLAPASGRDVVLQVWTQDITSGANPRATAKEDYAEILQTPVRAVTIPAGATTGTVTVEALGDTLDEADEEWFQFRVQQQNLGPGVEQTVQVDGASRILLVGICDDDDPPEVTVRAETDAEGKAVVTEGDTAGFVLELSAVSGLDVTVPVATVDGTAVAGAASAGGDYTAVDRDVTIDAGKGVGTEAVRVPVQTVDTLNSGGDEVSEGDETFSLRIGTPTNATRGTPNSAEMTIVDDDLAASIANAAAREGEDITFTVTLSGAAPAGGAQVAVYTRNLTTGADRAAAGTDYTAIPQDPVRRVTILEGETTATFTVETTHDETVEGDETFQVVLSRIPGEVPVGDARAVGTIVNDDTRISVADAEGPEDDPETEEGGKITFTVSLAPALSDVLGDDLDVVVGYATEVPAGDDAATPGEDYTAPAAGSDLTIAAGGDTATFVVDTLHDTLDEADETFTVRLSGPKVGSEDGRFATGGDTATGTILDNDDRPTLRINDPAAVTEGGTILFTITLSEASGRAVTFTAETLSLNYGTDRATPGEDYRHGSQEITIPAGETTAGFAVATIDDELYEGGALTTERFRVRISVPPRYEPASIRDRTGIGRIRDNDDPPTLGVTADAATVTEGEKADFTVTLSAASGRPVSARAATVDGTATAGADYRSAVRFVRFPPGATSRTLSITVETLDDSDGEADETFSLALGNVAGATPDPASAEVTITDDDVEINIGDATALEGDPLRFLVTLNASPTEEVTVDWRTNDLSGDGAATSTGDDYDYTAANGTLTFEPGARVRVITVASRADSLAEDDERFQVVLSSPTNARIGGRLATGTILDGSPRLLTLTGNTATEGEDLTFTLTLDKPRSEATTPTLRGLGGTSVTVGGRQTLEPLASPGVDYTLPAANSAFTIPAGQTSITFKVPTVDDDLDEPDEHVVVAFDPPFGTYGDGIPGLATIIDNDDLPKLSVTGGEAPEGDTITFTVSLSAPSDRIVSVRAETVAGTATAGSDYTHYVRRLDFAPGVEQRTITVATTEDTTVESDETFQLRLSAATNATIAVAAGTGTIRDDDTGLSIADAEPVEEGDPLTFTVTLGRAAAGTVTVAWATRDGTATAPDDYTSAGGTLTFPPGTTERTVQVTTIEDTETEGYELLEVALSNARGATIEDGTATGTILDADTVPRLTVEPVTVTEGETANVVLSLDRPSLTDIVMMVISWAPIGPRNATDNVDFTGRRFASLTIPAGATSATFGIPTVDDELDEHTEYVGVRYARQNGDRPTGVQPDQAIRNRIVTILDNDPAPMVSVEGPGDVTEGDVATFVVRLSEPAGRPTRVSVLTEAGTATAPGDFVARSQRLTFAQEGGLAGVTEMIVAVPTVDDAVAEEAETFKLVLQYPSGLQLDVASAEVRVLDNDVTVGVADTSASEGETLQFEVALNAPLLEDVTVTWQTQALQAGDARATSGTDFVAVTDGEATIKAGETSVNVAVDSEQDTVHEGDERFQVRLTGATGAPRGDTVGIGTILDDDTTVSVTGGSASEGAPVGFVVRLSEPLSRPVTVGYATEDLTEEDATDAATAGDDYVAVTAGEVTVPAGQTEATVQVETLSDDDDDEPDERFRLRLTSASPGRLAADPAAVGTILNETLPVLSVADAAAVEEGNDASFALRLSAASTEAVKVRVATAAHSGSRAATPGTDFTVLAADFEVTIPAGTTEATVTVKTLDDDDDEYDTEYFWVELLPFTADAPALLGDRRARGAINDNDDAPTLSVTAAPTTVTEGGTVTFTLALDEASTRPLVAVYVTAGTVEGTATRAAIPARVACSAVPADAHGDFEHAAGTVTFAAGDTSATVTVRTCNDPTDEGIGASEAFRLNARLSDAGADATTGATVTIIDNDPLPTLTISNATADEGDDLVFGLRLSHRSELPTAILAFDDTYDPTSASYGDRITDYRVRNASSWGGHPAGRAIPPDDYSFVSRPVWFTFPLLDAEFRVRTHRNSAGRDHSEGEFAKEILGLKAAETLNIASGNALGIGTITDRPLQRVGLYGRGTGAETSLTMEARLLDDTIGPLDTDLVLQYWTTHTTYFDNIHGTFRGRTYFHGIAPALAGLDYRAVPFSAGATVTIKAGETKATFPIEVYDDDIIEPTEIFLLHLAEATTNTAPVEGLPISVNIYTPDNDSIVVNLDRTGGPNYREGGSIRFTPRLEWLRPNAPEGKPALPAALTLTFRRDTRTPNVGSNDDLELPEVVIPAGEGPFASIEIPIIDDDVTEGTECVRLVIEPGKGMLVFGDDERRYGLFFPGLDQICIRD